MVGKGAKASLTTYRILSYEYLCDDGQESQGSMDPDGGDVAPRRLPVTRVELTPVTGRTHQLRVHCAAAGHPIVGDSIYGYRGEGAPRGGLLCDAAEGAGAELQRSIDSYWKRRQHKKSDKVKCMLCLHAQRLTVSHPFTEAPMVFECTPTF